VSVLVLLQLILVDVIERAGAGCHDWTGAVGGPVDAFDGEAAPPRAAIAIVRARWLATHKAGASLAKMPAA